MTAPDIAHWQARARKVLDVATWEYLEAGADDGITTAGAAAQWEQMALRPRILRGIGKVETGCALLGQRLRLPVLTSPNGRATRYHPDGEAAILAGTAQAGSLAILPSSVAGAAAGLAATVPGARWWQQLYAIADRARFADLLAALRDAGCTAIVLTVDLLPAAMTTTPAPPPAAWEAGAVPMPPALFTGATWDDLAWLIEAARLPVLVKGVLRGDDADRAIAAGAAGVMVSNHGGNQLDTAIGSAAALAEVAAAVGRRGLVLVDGGIRRGTSVLKAMALGADAVLVGRPTSYALAADGEAGVAAMLGGLESELARTMALCGAARLAEITPDLIGR
jgi:4-hydroxymandelate oxidase